MQMDIKSELHESMVKRQQLEEFIDVLNYLEKIDNIDLLKREMKAFKKWMGMLICFEKQLKEKKKSEYRMSKVQ